MNPDWLTAPAATPDEKMRAAARARQDQLTKPPGALGQLETAAIQLAALQGRLLPAVERVHIAVFAADHGVATEGVSAFPQAVTAEMLKNFARGGAAINVLARQLDATLEVINLGTVFDPGNVPGVIENTLGAGSANFTREPAMSAEQLAAALDAGRQAAVRAHAAGAQLFIGGEMGIANTTAATALGCALLNIEPAALAGRGTGLDAAGVAHKAAVVARALTLHGDLSNPLDALRCVSGFEIAALAGSYLACAQLGVPVLVDGFITTAAALAAVRIAPGVRDWLLFGHASHEQGHTHLLAALDAQPLLRLNMRLGEASGAAVAVPLLRLACALHRDMATFAEAGVSGG